MVPILAAMTSSGGPLAGIWARVNPFAVGRVTLEFGQEGTGPGYFTNARYVAVDNNGHIFVGEFNGGRVQVFDENGNYLTQWKATGEETGDIYLTGMAADRNGVVYTVVGSMLYVYDGRRVISWAGWTTRMAGVLMMSLLLLMDLLWQPGIKTGMTSFALIKMGRTPCLWRMQLVMSPMIRKWK